MDRSNYKMEGVDLTVEKMEGSLGDVWEWNDIGENINMTAKRPRVTSHRLMLTYKTHLNKDDFIEWFRNNFDNYLTSKIFIRIAHEKGDTGYNHTHVLIEFDRNKIKGVRFDVSKCFNYPVYFEIIDAELEGDIYEGEYEDDDDREEEYDNLNKLQPKDYIIPEDNVSEDVLSVDEDYFTLLEMEGEERIDDRTGVISKTVTLHPNVKKITNDTHWINSLKYLAKEDKDNIDLIAIANELNTTTKKAKGVLSDDDYNSIALCKNEFDAIKLGSKLKLNANNSRIIWQAGKHLREIIIKKDMQPLKGWQIKVENLIKTKPSDRKVYWFYDEEGGHGKSYLAKYLTNEYENCITVSCAKDERNFLYMLGNKLEENKSINTIIIDIVRSAFVGSELYESIEKLKDGRIDVEKYCSRQINFNPCHVIVLSNRQPVRKMLSLDRWIIYDITKMDKFAIKCEDEKIHFDDDKIKDITKDEAESLLNYMIENYDSLDNNDDEDI